MCEHACARSDEEVGARVAFGIERPLDLRYLGLKREGRRRRRAEINQKDPAEN
jgi:hypothetical protein